MLRKPFCLITIYLFSFLSTISAASSPEYVSSVSQNFSAERAALREGVTARADNNTAVIVRFDTFMDNLFSVYEAGEGFIHRDIERIMKALAFATEKHEGQWRINEVGAPYIIHPIGVADYVLTIGQVRDADIIIAALLHDTVEDTDTTLEEIETIFGSRVSGFVAEVTDDKSLLKMERKRLQIEHAPDKSSGAAQIKLGDKLYNLTDLYDDPITGWPKERIDAYFVWAWDVVDALPWVNAKLKNRVRFIVDRYWQREALLEDEKAPAQASELR